MLHDDLSLGLFFIALDRPTAVIAGAIRDHNNRPSRIGVKFLEKLHKARAIHASLETLEPHIPPRAHRADQLQAKTIATVLHLRRLADLAPGRTPMGVGTHHRLIHKVNHRPHAPRFRLQSGKGFLQIFLHLLRVALVTFVDRSWRAEPQMPQQPADSTFTQLHSKLTLQQGSYHSQGPQAEGKLILPRIVLGDGLIQPAQQFGIHLALASTALTFAQRVIATVPISFQPFKNRSGGSLEHARHDRHGISCADRVHGCSPFLISGFQCGRNGLRFAPVLLSHEPIMPEYWAVNEYIYATGIYL